MMRISVALYLYLQLDKLEYFPIPLSHLVVSDTMRLRSHVPISFGCLVQSLIAICHASCDITEECS